jgi:hypothetical protein
MKKFILKILVFCIPLLFILLPPSLYLFTIKENFFDLESFIINHKSEKYLIGYTYNEKNYKFLKWKELSNRPKQKIWSLGSSRAMQFRNNMFDDTFYNVGYTVGKINEFLPFMKSVSNSKHPDVLIVTLDTWMFNSRYDKLDDLMVDQTKWTNSFKMYPDFPILKSVWNDLIKNKFDSNKIYKDGGIYRIGYNAVYKNSGFRNDGSFYYGEQIKKLIANDSTCSDYNFKGTFLRIDKGINRFEHGKTINYKAVEELSKFLNFCKERKIKVVLILPPFPEATCKRMVLSGNYNYINTIPEKCRILAKKNGFEFYDFTNPKSCNAFDREFVDGFHGSEKVYLKMLIKILESESVLNKFVKIERIKRDLTESISDYQVYKE